MLVNAYMNTTGCTRRNIHLSCYNVSMSHQALGAVHNEDIHILILQCKLNDDFNLCKSNAINIHEYS